MASKDVVFVFSSKAPPDSTSPVMRGLVSDAMKEFSVGLDDLANWFKGFDIDSVEITISAGVETGGLTKLFISAKGEGGLTVTLKPRK
ncbi:MAG TPA: hypothetical protein VGS04_06335 [Nitrososphaerales archaeon]|nr:hypothetical protein [Nitrososphaerales archaeon]